MKKIIAILSTAALLVAITSCASTKTEVAPATDAAATDETVPCINNPAPKADVLLLDGFEEGNYWQAVGDSWDQWGAHNLSLEAETQEDWATEGSTGGSWVFDEATSDSSKQACFFCDALAEVDWTAYKYIYIDVKNINSEPIEMGLAVQAGSWTWYQTEAQKLGIGENKNIKFDLGCITSADDKALINRGIFQVLGENKGGTILVDNIRLAND